MRLIDWSRGAGIRIAGLTTILVMVVVLLLGGFVYSLVDDALRVRVRILITDDTARLLDDYDPSHPERLVAAVEARTRAGTPRRYAYRVTKPDGTHLAGDVWLESTPIGWHSQDVDSKYDQTVTDGQITVFTRALEPGMLVSIGRASQWVAQVESELHKLFGSAIALAVASSVLISLLIKLIIARRITAVTNTAMSIMDGKLAQRIPTTGADDDFDRLADTLNQMLERIRVLMDSLSQVTNDIAHDLRTPLGRLRQKLEQVRQDTSLAEHHAIALDTAISEADGLLATFTAMLRIAQIDSGVRRVGFRSVDLSDVARTVCEAYEFDADESGHVLHTAIDDGVMLQGERDLLVQMSVNLVENALTHTPPGTTIRVGVHRSQAGVELTADDDGPGVPADEIDKLFRRFYRAEASRTTPGTGLGLSLVAAVARLHGGTITAADNAPGLRIKIVFSDVALS